MWNIYNEDTDGNWVFLKKTDDRYLALCFKMQGYKVEKEDLPVTVEDEYKKVFEFCSDFFNQSGIKEMLILLFHQDDSGDDYNDYLNGFTSFCMDKKKYTELDTITLMELHKQFITTDEALHVINNGTAWNED